MYILLCIVHQSVLLYVENAQHGTRAFKLGVFDYRDSESALCYVQCKCSTCVDDILARLLLATRRTTMGICIQLMP